jgi:hypothetical protein
MTDDVYFDAASGAITVTVSALANCYNLDCTGFTGTLAGGFGISHRGSIFIASSTMTWTQSSSVQFSYAGTVNVTTNGKSLACALTVNSVSTTVDLMDALTSTNALAVTSGTLNTNDYNVTASSLSSSNNNTRTINLGSSTVTLSGITAIGFLLPSNLTLNAGTSNIICSRAAGSTISGGGSLFYNVTFSSNAQITSNISGNNTFNNLSVTGRTTEGIQSLVLLDNQTINGTLTLSAGTNATMRTFVRSNTIGTTCTLTCAAVASLQDIDFRDITIAGAAAPVSGTRLGDCKGNSGITFPAAKTVYWRSGTNANWGATPWSFTNGGANDVTAFPLAQDTAVFPSSPTPYPTSGNTATINAAYNIGTIDMSARTSNTMTLATGSTTPQIYGNWINGTGTTLTGTNRFTFAGRTSQTITSAGRTFTQAFTIESPSGSVTLQDAFSASLNASAIIRLLSGTFDANGYNVTCSGATSTVDVSSATTARTIALGSGTWSIAGTGSAWNAATSTNLTVTGTGTISLTSASAKTFAGGGIQTYPTLNQGGTGTLTVTGSNKFAGLTNTAIGRIQFTGGTTNEFTAFNINGVSGNLLQLGSSNTTQAILIKPTAWSVGANSTDAGNNTGLSFTAGGNDYLSVSYINGQVSAAPTSDIYYGAINITAIYYGSTPVTAIYYGATQVF